MPGLILLEKWHPAHATLTCCLPSQAPVGDFLCQLEAKHRGHESSTDYEPTCLIILATYMANILKRGLPIAIIAVATICHTWKVTPDVATSAEGKLDLLFCGSHFIPASFTAPRHDFRHFSHARIKLWQWSGKSKPEMTSAIFYIYTSRSKQRERFHSRAGNRKP